jgi:hypothetical protein
MNEDLKNFLLNMGEQIEIDQRFYEEYEQPSYEMGSLRFIPEVSGSGGSGENRIPVRMPDGTTYIQQSETQGGGRLGGTVELPSGASFGGGVSGDYFRGKLNMPEYLQQFGEPSSITYGPSGMVTGYDARFNLPSGISGEAFYNPVTDDYSIMTRYTKDF